MQVRRHFSQYVNPALAQNELWVEFDGSPLKWQYPFGLHFDLLKPELPFNLTVHFDNFPEGKLIPCPNKEAVRSHFMSVVKEADALKHKGSIVNSMQEKEHFTLWAGLQNGMRK
jgi:autophagy-related protein 5